ncbi:MAG TPA: GDP-mannose 4,6-dehydratase [Blastocatellia bacterium]|nr:GDP-mannose 4,6-dehydratase [Blastocatellia bacterium]
MADSVLITGGAGFIGINLADRLLEMGQPVLILDNLSRAGVERNLSWLRRRWNGRSTVEAADVRDFNAVRLAVRRASRVYHLAAQVAVSTGLKDPLFDFDVNAKGTLNVLEAIRSAKHPIPLLLTSTNRVYGALNDIPVRQEGLRYTPVAPDPRASAVDESRPLDLSSPYGCSKGAADQYVRDYSRTFGIPAAVFRMSCIYGPHQSGAEGEGWAGRVLLRALTGLPTTIYGSGFEVSDILFVRDLVDALVIAMKEMPRLNGEAFNIGGGPENTMSLLELVELIREVSGIIPEFECSGARPGAQSYYVSDTRKFAGLTGWSPRTSVREGIGKLYQWAVEWLSPAAARALTARHL